MTTIRSRNCTADLAIIIVTSEKIDFCAKFDRDGNRSIEIITGAGRSTAATAGGIAKRLGLAAEAAAMFEERDASHAAAKKASAPAKVAKLNDGFDTALAKRAGIPNLAGWSQDGGALRFCGWTIFAHLDGFAWAAAGEVHLTSAKRPFRSALDACRSAQAAQFPDWKKGSFENFIAAAA